MARIKQINSVKWMKLSVAVPLSMAAAGALELQYASSAGIITLLTVQDTKKETLELVLRRAAAFGIMTALCAAVFGTAGHNIFAYGIFLCLFLLFCYWLKLDNAISMNAVLACHYLAGTEIDLLAVCNEAALLGIGAGMGVLVNLAMPENLTRIRQEQARIDAAMRKILERMAVYLCREDRQDYTGECFAQVDVLLASMEREATLRIRNTFTKGDTYFISYMRMRMRQCEILKRIYESIMCLTFVPVQAKALSLFLEEISDSFHEKNNVRGLMETLRQMRESYRASALPKTREEFENRAILMQITGDLERFLRIKREFIENLTAEEQIKYWK